MYIICGGLQGQGYTLFSGRARGRTEVILILQKGQGVNCQCEGTLLPGHFKHPFLVHNFKRVLCLALLAICTFLKAL